MSSLANAINSAIHAGIIACEIRPADADTSWQNVDPRSRSFLDQVKNRVTLFIGAAASTFKPAKLPMWDKFIELLWSSILENAVEDLADKENLSRAFKVFFENATASTDSDRNVPNYLITEIIARRLGTQYLDLLEAFEAQKTDDGEWAINQVHKWAAEGLIHGDFAAIVTTNFDDYIERALENANATWYKITGNPHIDGAEISSRLQNIMPNRRLVLIVNGANAFSFVRILSPQLGRDKITFLLKIHGSCYEPDSCIDTRLQRSQGLPSYVTDMLDTLIQRTVWFVAGFSGSDMNDNLDYLRLISNRSNARVVWLQYPGAPKESAVKRLLESLHRSDSERGICLLHGNFVGEKTSIVDSFPAFDQKVKDWAKNLGIEWCRLVLLDLTMFIDARGDHKIDHDLLKAINEGELPRQDWNNILSRMDLNDQSLQIAPAQLCMRVSALLQEVFDLHTETSVVQREELLGRLNSALVDLNQQNSQLQSAALTERPHAQTWVLSALCGLILLCGDQPQSAMKALEMASSTAWLVGDFEIYQSIQRAISELSLSELPGASEGADTSDGTNVGKASSFVAFVPSMDNVNSKMNRFGIPPAAYVRALLHRSILFADGIAVPPNILTNSSVFVNEILFQGDQNTLNETYLQYIFPMLPRTFEGAKHKLLNYKQQRVRAYMQEMVDQQHVRALDEYFERPEHAGRFMYYDESVISRDYGKYIRKQVDNNHSEATIKHLVQLWNHIEAGGWWNVSQEEIDRLPVAEEAAKSLMETLREFFDHLPDKVFRSVLYSFADLFSEASDSSTFLAKLSENTSDEAKLRVRRAREKIIDKPWLYGPFCREIFDAPYKSNLAFDIASRSASGAFVFLEEDEVPSWQFMSHIRGDSASPVRIETSGISDGDSKCSSLLLSQVSEDVLMRNRNKLGRIRRILARGARISEHDRKIVRNVMQTYMDSSLDLADHHIESLTVFQPRLKEIIKILLRQCVFLIRRGPPLDRMYEEALLTVPGLAALRSDAL